MAEKRTLRAPTSIEGVQAAIDFYGGFTAAAHKLGVTEGAVRRWLRQGFVPLEIGLLVHRATKGEINVYDLIGIPKWANR